MESYNQNTVAPEKSEKPSSENNRSGRVFGGLIVVAVGAIFLARETGFYLPRWIVSWEMLLIAIGLFLGFRHSFKNYTWLVLILIGSVFLIDDIYPYADLGDYAWPLIIIGVGLFMIFKPTKKHRDRNRRGWENSIKADQTFADDYIDSTVIFGSIKKNVISKNFRGGDTTTIFGGTEINLTQADVTGRIMIDMTQIFGGTKLIVPPHWKIQSEDLVSIFGGMEDKRPQVADPSIVDPNKVLVLHGTCIFGGIEIKSF
jgi:predicted membrane protein